MLRTKPYHLSKLLHFFENINSKNTSITFCGRKDTIEHRKCSSFTSTVMTQESKDLSFVHGHTCAFDSLLFAKVLIETSHLETVIGLFKSLKVVGNLFKVTRILVFSNFIIIEWLVLIIQGFW